MTNWTLSASHDDALTIHVTDGPGKSSVTPAKRDQSAAGVSDANKGSKFKRNRKEKHAKHLPKTQVQPLAISENTQPKPWDAPSLRHLFSFASETPANSSVMCTEHPTKLQSDSFKTIDITSPKTGDPSSLRHLFSFASQTHTNSSPAKSEIDQGFRLERGKTLIEPEAQASNGEAKTTDKPQEGFVFFARGTKAEVSADKFEANGVKHAQDSNVPRTVQNEVTSAEPCSFPSENDYSFSYIGAHPSHDPQHTVHYDLYDEDAIANAANKFRRTVAIADIRDQFEAEDGIREMMRRDFKLKRQNSLRGRKLGSAPPGRFQDESGNDQFSNNHHSYL